MLFISYSHEDEQFVNRLAARLLEQRIAVWWDRIAIKVGDSLLDKIQGAIAEADFLAVVLSNSSVQSAWCCEELKAGLMRQLAEKRVVVLPLLMEDCELPVFLADKKYADFRNEFDRGFQELLAAIAPLADPTLGRRETDEYQSDYGMDWHIRDGHFVMEIDAVSFSKSEPYSVMAQVRLTGNEVATRRYRQFEQAGLKEAGMAVVMACCEDAFDSPQAHISLDDNKAITLQCQMGDPKMGMRYDVSFWARRIGQATGTTVLYHFGSIFGEILRHLIQTKRPMSYNEKRALAAILKTPPQ